MWAFFSKRLRMWLVLAVVAPVVGRLLGKLGEVIEERRGQSAVTKVLRGSGGFLGNRSKGPLAKRIAADPAGPRDRGVPAR